MAYVNDDGVVSTLANKQTFQLHSRQICVGRAERGKQEATKPKSEEWDPESATSQKIVSKQLEKTSCTSKDILIVPVLHPSTDQNKHSDNRLTVHDWTCIQIYHLVTSVKLVFIEVSKYAPTDLSII